MGEEAKGESHSQERLRWERQREREAGQWIPKEARKRILEGGRPLILGKEPGGTRIKNKLQGKSLKNSKKRGWCLK